MDRIQALVNWLAQQGEMEFSAFVVAARAAGLEPAVWHKAKTAGLLVATIRNGVHYIKAA